MYLLNIDTSNYMVEEVANINIRLMEPTKARVTVKKGPTRTISPKTGDECILPGIFFGRDDKVTTTISY
jgi:hypothetical protein